MAPHVPPGNDRKRVKVYELKDNDWFDRGTGFCTGHFVNVSHLPDPRETRMKARERKKYKEEWQARVERHVHLFAYGPITRSAADLDPHRRNLVSSPNPKTIPTACCSRHTSAGMFPIKNNKVIISLPHRSPSSSLPIAPFPRRSPSLPLLRRIPSPGWLTQLQTPSSCGRTRKAPRWP